MYEITTTTDNVFVLNSISIISSIELSALDCNSTDGNEPVFLEGCTDDSACNFDSSANTNDGSCVYSYDGFDCDGNCINDLDEDGVCDEDEILGCTDNNACNFNPSATQYDNSCLYPTPSLGYDLSVSPADWSGTLIDITTNELVLIDENNDLGCHDIEMDLSNSIALIKRGDCQFSLKALNAQNAGAVAVIIYNNNFGSITLGAGDFASDIEIPVYAMSGTDGHNLAIWLSETNSYVANLYEHTLNISIPSYDCEGNCINDVDAVEIVKHEAGLRPTVKDRRALVGNHPKFANVFVFNGLGTRGLLIAPLLSLQFVDHLDNATPLDPEVDITRFKEEYPC